MNTSVGDSLNDRIAALEDLVTLRRSRLTTGTLALKQAIRQRAGSAGAVFGAICLGVALGRKRNRDPWSVLNVLNAISTCTTLFVALSPPAVPAHPDPVLSNPN